MVSRERCKMEDGRIPDRFDDSGLVAGIALVFLLVLSVAAVVMVFLGYIG
jgi:hypothetical protein